MKNKKVIIWSIAVVLVLVIIFSKIDLSSFSEEEILPGERNAKITFVNGQIIKSKSIQNKITSNGTLLSNEEVEIRSEISGKITKILFKEGEHVKGNDLLVKINDADLQATLMKNLSKENLARNREYRYKQLLEKNLTSQQEYDVAASELSSVLADLEYTKAMIEKTEIRAPFDGIVGLRSVSVGSYISPQTKIATLQSINPIKADFSVPQKYFNLIKKDKSIFVTLPASGKIYKGTVYAVEPKIDQNTRTVQARALIPNTGGELAPGSYVEIEIVLEDLQNSILVPTDVIIPDLEGESIFLYKNGKALLQRVDTGLRTKDEIQITTGLSVGDTLIVSGLIQLRAGAAVKLNSIN